MRRNKKIWIFGDRFGNRYDDNSKFLYEYVVNNEKHIKAVWITDNKNIIKKLRSRGELCFGRWSFKGIIYSLFAGVGIVSFSRYDINSALMGNVIWVNLHHGNTIKKDFDNKMLKVRIINFLLKYLFRFRTTYYDYMICSNLNKKLINSFSEHFKIPKTNFLLSGLPRNDFFYSHSIHDSNNTCKRILYAPTFRVLSKEKKVDLFYKYKWNTDLINNFLIDKNLYLIIRPHPHLKLSKKLFNEIDKVSNIFFSNSLETSPQAELLKSDYLITDYSGIYIDFLHLKKPIIMAPFDFDEFEKSEGLNYDYEKVGSKTKILNWEDFTKIKFDELVFDKQHKKIFDYFDFYQDGSNSKRAYKKIYDAVF